MVLEPERLQHTRTVDGKAFLIEVSVDAGGFWLSHLLGELRHRVTYVELHVLVIESDTLALAFLPGSSVKLTYKNIPAAWRQRRRV